MKSNSLRIVSVARSFEMTKTVKDKNLNTRKVSITEVEKNTILSNDSLVLRVKDEDGNFIGVAFYTGQQFQEKLVRREKTSKRGSKITFYTLPYIKT